MAALDVPAVHRQYCYDQAERVMTTYRSKFEFQLGSFSRLSTTTRTGYSSQENVRSFKIFALGTLVCLFHRLPSMILQPIEYTENFCPGGMPTPKYTIISMRLRNPIRLSPVPDENDTVIPRDIAPGDTRITNRKIWAHIEAPERPPEPGTVYCEREKVILEASFQT
jgi:hypothetical protein